MKCVDYKEVRKGALLGFASIAMPSGMVIRDCSHCESGGKQWVAPPGKPQIDKDKQTVFKDGKLQYTNIITFTTRDKQDAWGAAALEAVQAYLAG
jgi:hypothetical protein